MGNTLVIYKIYPNEVGEEDKIIESVKKITIAEVKDVKKRACCLWHVRCAIREYCFWKSRKD